MTIRTLWAKLIKILRGNAIRNSEIHKLARIRSGCNISSSKVGKYVGIGYDCNIFNTIIGNFSSIADNVVINPGAHPLNWVSTSTAFYSHPRGVPANFSNLRYDSSYLPVQIGSDVWIGSNSIIKEGVTIGHGAVIGMGSVVTKDVPPYMIVGGVPAKEIRKRFDDEIIAQLLESKWWDMEDAILKKYTAYMNQPKEFLKRIYKDMDNSL